MAAACSTASRCGAADVRVRLGRIRPSGGARRAARGRRRPACAGRRGRAARRRRLARRPAPRPRVDEHPDARRRAPRRRWRPDGDAASRRTAGCWCTARRPAATSPARPPARRPRSRGRAGAAAGRRRPGAVRRRGAHRPSRRGGRRRRRRRTGDAGRRRAGGVLAAELAASRPAEPFVVDQVVTAGAPAAQVPRLPDRTRVLALEDRADPVALLGSLVNAGDDQPHHVVFDAAGSRGGRLRRGCPRRRGLARRGRRARPAARAGLPRARLTPIRLRTASANDT